MERNLRREGGLIDHIILYNYGTTNDDPFYPAWLATQPGTNTYRVYNQYTLSIQPHCHSHPNLIHSPSHSSTLIFTHPNFIHTPSQRNPLIHPPSHSPTLIFTHPLNATRIRGAD